jgi:fluoride ion exporter CrcB/FEX
LTVWLAVLLGGFTTFSSFMLDSLTLWEARAVTTMALNLAVQLTIGLALVYVGYQVACSEAPVAGVGAPVL